MERRDSVLILPKVKIIHVEMNTHSLKIREQSGQSLQWLLSGSEASQLFSGYRRCHIASNIVEY